MLISFPNDSHLAGTQRKHICIAKHIISGLKVKVGHGTQDIVLNTNMGMSVNVYVQLTISSGAKIPNWTLFTWRTGAFESLAAILLAQLTID